MFLLRFPCKALIKKYQNFAEKKNGSSFPSPKKQLIGRSEGRSVHWCVGPNEGAKVGPYVGAVVRMKVHALVRTKVQRCVLPKVRWSEGGNVRDYVLTHDPYRLSVT
jgi:hypothetical protein